MRMDIADELFKVIDPSGHKFVMFTDGRIEGFADGSIVINNFPAISAYRLSRSKALAVNQDLEGK